MHKRVLVAMIAASLSLAGCAGGATSKIASPERQQFIETAPPGLGPYFDALYTEGEWSAVLHFNRLGLAAIDTGQFQLAERAFDQSLQRIETIYADNPGAKKARGLWTAEGSKDFKGEPYERSMAYYYRGLLFMRAGEFDNARAAFRSAEYQDTLSEAELFQSDFALMPLLAGWASLCSGDSSMAQSFFDQARAQAPQVPLPQSGDDALTLFEAGASPTKAADGEHGEMLRVLAPATVDAPGAEGWTLLGDIGYQATTRGGRPVDHILAGKAQFKETSGAIGEGAMAASAALLNAAQYASTADQMGDMANLGAAAGVIGLFATVMSNQTKPKADTRYWDTLPAQVRGSFSSAAAGLPAVGASPPRIDAQHPHCRVVVYRGAPADTASAGRGNLTDSERLKVLRRNARRDTAFRAALADTVGIVPIIDAPTSASASASIEESAR